MVGGQDQAQGRREPARMIESRRVGDTRASAPFDQSRRARSSLSAQLGSRVLGLAESYDLLFRITYVSASRKFKNRFRWVTFVCNLSIDMKNCMKVTKSCRKIIFGYNLFVLQNRRAFQEAS